MSTTLKINGVSLIVSSILAALGILRHDLTLLIPAMIISPIGEYLRNITRGLIKMNPEKILNNVLLLGVMLVIIIIVGLIFSRSKNIKESEIKQFGNWSKDRMFHFFTGLLIGAFTNYILLISPDTITIMPQIIGAGIAITLLPPLADVGVRLGSSKLMTSKALADVKIFGANAAGFIIGTAAVQIMLG